MIKQKQHEMEQHVERSFRNPQVIDLIFYDTETTEVVLLIVVDTPWDNTHQQCEQLQEKFNNYLDYVLDGFLTQHYPQYKNKMIRFQLECLAPPQGVELELLKAMQKYLESIKMKMIVEVKETREVVPDSP